MANVNRTRRSLLAAAGASVSAAVLSACGSSTVESAITPSRFISFGDGFSDVGQSGTRYTVNDDTVNIWAQEVASSYGGTLTAVSAGGYGYAVAHARVTNTTNAIGTANAGSITTQIDTFLASNTPTSNDLYLVEGGYGDIVAEYASYAAGTTTQAQAQTNLATAGTELAAQVKRLITAGAKYVLVTGVYDLSVSPWAESLSLTSLFSSLSSSFNNALLVALNDLTGTNVLYVDAAYYFNLFHNSGSSYGFSDVDTPVCISTDAGSGIGAGEVNSGLCTTSTLISGVTDYSVYLFADKLYPTPSAHRQYGVYVYDRLRARW
ncbi:SGNH/GDSL hydrolase family protein [Xylophilus sp.]|uniref:SGNH/GDSL hydrolase family protein n=1 Tax=Xylophilus sp. TaxID=2653893 RepID=UPI0013BC8CA7|nr:SGNH/GDSL hydrolase family protein [Xylophilus sp.]KAF1048218.1 MAG: Esterase EstA [Xylophilus sp.]